MEIEFTDVQVIKADTPDGVYGYHCAVLLSMRIEDMDKSLYEGEFAPILLPLSLAQKLRDKLSDCLPSAN